MKAVIGATAFALLLIFSPTMTGLGSTCSTKGLECPKSKICCDGHCVSSRKVCKVPCQELGDCDSSLNETCFFMDLYCKCSSSFSCNNLCQTAPDCLRSNAYCNQTCENLSTFPTEGDRPEELPLNPALLAIVTIMGVLIFSFLFCCCLSRMKSERKSVQAREAKGKLKSLGIERRTTEVIESENALPLIKAESQSAASARNGILAAETFKNTISRDKEKEMLISVVVESGLPPIREEDEEGEQEKE